MREVLFTYRQVMNFAAFHTFEVGMRLEIRAVTGRRTIQINLLDQTASNKSFQAIVNGCKGNGGKFFLHSQKNVISGRMIPFFHNHLVNATSLLGWTQTIALESFRKVLFVIYNGIHDEITNKSIIAFQARIFGIILIRKRRTFPNLVVGKTEQTPKEGGLGS